MILYFLEPEVSGGHGEHTIYGSQADIALEGISGKVKYLHYEFEGWLGDDLLESTPAFIVSSKLEIELENSDLRDYKLEKCLITKSDEFKEMYPNKELPTFSRFIPLGKIEVEGENFKNWSGNSFCLSPKGVSCNSRSNGFFKEKSFIRELLYYTTNKGIKNKNLRDITML